jgi:MFS family permease
VLAIRLLDRLGRRPLLIGGGIAMGAALFGLGLSFALGAEGTVGAVAAILSLMAFVAAFAISLGPIFWLLNAEIYPLRVRSKAAAVGTMANWLFNFVVSLTFLILIDELGRSGTFFLYAAICGFTVWFCWKLVPETKGKHLEDIQALFRERARERAEARAATS